MTTLSLDDFRALNAPGRRRSTLAAFADDLMQLLDDGYSFRQLLDYLAANDVHTCLSNLHGFVARWRRRHNPPPATKAAPADSASAPPPAAHMTAPLLAAEPHPALDRPAAASPAMAPRPPAPTRPAPRPAGSVREIIRQARAQPHNLYEYAEIARKAFANRDADKLKDDPANPATTQPTAKS